MDLPDCLLKIVSFLDIKSIINFSLVSKTIRNNLNVSKCFLDPSLVIEQLKLLGNLSLKPLIFVTKNNTNDVHNLLCTLFPNTKR